MTVAEILEGIPRLRVLIAGDICLDRWCTYDPRQGEPSRETGLPRIGVVSTEVTPGGGGTVASNIAALGAARVAVLGVAGDDGNGFELARALKQRGIDSTHLIRANSFQTFTYTKLINRVSGIEDRPRVDFIHAEPLLASLEERLLASLREIYNEFDVIVALDQSEIPECGAITAAMRQTFAEIGRTHADKVIWADSRIRCELFRGMTVKVNRLEAGEACKRLNIAMDFEVLRAAIGAPRLFVTDGPDGVHIATASSTAHVSARRIENPVDICGAGDSFSAGAACALAMRAEDSEAALFGNLVASVTVMKRGTGTASPTELLALIG